MLKQYEMAYYMMEKCNSIVDLIPILPKLNMDLINVVFKTTGVVG